MTATREPIPPGRVSIVRGRWQGPALMWLTRVVLVVALIGGFAGGPVGRALAATAVAIVVAIPIARVVWLVGRWQHERDTRFVIAGIVLLITVGAGALLALLGID